jgi:cell division protein FtsZ
MPLFGQTDNSVNQSGVEIELKLKNDDDRPILREPEKPNVQKPVDKPSTPRPGDKPILNKPEDKPVEDEDGPGAERSYVFEFKPGASNAFSEDVGDDRLSAADDEFKVGNEIAADQIINDEGMMEIRKTKERLEQQAKERRERLKANKKQEMTKEEFNEKWTLPAYLRRGVKVDSDVPHSSEPFISRYNLNDDNNLLGNNKFLHDNVD